MCVQLTLQPMRPLTAYSKVLITFQEEPFEQQLGLLSLDISKVLEARSRAAHPFLKSWSSHFLFFVTLKLQSKLPVHLLLRSSLSLSFLSGTFRG